MMMCATNDCQVSRVILTFVGVICLSKMAGARRRTLLTFLGDDVSTDRDRFVIKSSCSSRVSHDETSEKILGVLVDL